jgi:predicted DNA-binding transcriptional regulator AlpA
MTLEKAGIRYFTAAEVAKGAGVSRTTLWRWRSEGKIPPGNRLRGRQLLFTEDELQNVLEYANHIEPVRGSEGQLKLFAGKRNGER